MKYGKLEKWAFVCPYGLQVWTGKLPWYILCSSLFHTWSFSQGQHNPHWMPPWSCIQDENDFLPRGSYTNLFMKRALNFKSWVYQRADCPFSCLAAFSNNWKFVALGIFLKTDWVIRYTAQLHLAIFLPSVHTEKNLVMPRTRIKKWFYCMTQVSCSLDFSYIFTCFLFRTYIRAMS